MQYLPIILASQSPARLELLKKIKIIPDKILPSNIDETEYLEELPSSLALRLARMKTIKIAESIKEPAIIIGADTVSACGRRILPKALTSEDVRYCLNMLSGRRHRVYTGVHIIKQSEGVKSFREKLVQTIIKFKRLTTEEIKFYCSLNEGLNKAGGYTIAGYAESFIAFMSGSYSNVRGLPLFETLNMLTSLGVSKEVQVSTTK